MKDWEFLIQKEGESWQLVLSSLKIETGKYRVAARTQQANLELEVSVAYRGEDSISYSRKQQRRTNDKGLVALMSWTDLQPGEWQINCYGDIISELLGEGWHQSLQLHVMSTMEATTGIPAEPAAAINKQETADIEQAWEEVAFNHQEEPVPATALPTAPYLEELVDPQPEVSPSLEEAEELTVIELRLTLYEDTFVKRVGEPILVSGQIEVPGMEQGNDWELVQGTLRYLLRDPQTTQILLNLEQQISEQSLPLIFSSSLEIPFEASLLLGEVILEVASEDENDQLVPVARQAFAVTANLEELLETFIEEGDGASSEAKETTPVSLRRISLFDPRKSTTNQRLRSRSSNHQVLPPKISAAATAKTEIQLPPLPKSPAPILSASKSFESAPKGDRTAVDKAFEALKLEERFWSRLSALKIEPEESEAASISEFSAGDNDEDEH